MEAKERSQRHQAKIILEHEQIAQEPYEENLSFKA